MKKFRKRLSIFLAVLMVLSTLFVANTSAAAKDPVETPTPLLTNAECQITLNDGVSYPCVIGNRVTYSVYLTAQELFEDIEASIHYDSNVLTLVNSTDYGFTQIPNLVDGHFYNDDLNGEIKFNSINLKGFDFTEEKILCTHEFQVIGEGNTDINLVIEEMTVKGDGTDSYFTLGEQVKFDGINLRYSLTSICIHDYIASFDETAHWKECSVCHDVIEKAEHSFDNSCDTSCSACDYTREITHDYIAAFDETEHWKECSVCHDIIEKAEHSFDNACDTSCSACDYTREITHDYVAAFDETAHWKECSVCHDVIEKAEHSFDNHVNADGDITIQDASAIQKYLVEIPTDYKIGEIM